MAKPRAGKQSLKKSGRSGSTWARRRSLAQQFRHSQIEQLERRDLFVASLSISGALAVEGANAVFSVTLSEAVSQEVTVDYTTMAGTAGSTQDFLAQSGTLTFQPNELTKTITIPTVNDSAGELREAFAVQLSNPQGADITTATGVGLIDDDDLIPAGPGNGTITVPTGATLGGDGSTESHIMVSSGGTLAPGGTPGTLTTTGSTTFESGATYRAELVNTAHDLLVTNGITLNGASLNVTSNANLGAGTAFLLIDNTSSDPVVGTFAGLPEGKGFFINGYQYFITYEYGVDGNDVAITRNRLVDAINDSFGPILANTSLTANTYSNDIDPDGDARSTVIVQPSNGHVFMDPATAQFTYTPNANFIGSDTFTYRLSDGEFNDTATVEITVVPMLLDDNGVLQVSGTTSGDNIIVQSGSVRYNSTTYPFTASKVVVRGNGGNDTITVTASNIAVEFYGGDGDDYLSGGSLNDILDGGDGTDQLFGNNGDDRLYGGGGGEATVSGGAGNDYLSGDGYLDASGVEQQAINGGNDTLSGDAGDDEIHGGKGMDTLYGGIGNDYLRGGDGGDSVDGGDGNDILFGDAGGDTLYGRAGNDVLIGGEGLDTLLGGTGSDLVYGGHVGTALAAGGVLLQTLANQWFVTSTQAAAVSGVGSHTLDDGVTDTLNGEGDDDWFLVYDKDLINATERFPGNRKSVISPFSINDVNVVEGENAQFTVSLLYAAAQALTLTYQTSSLTATSGVDFTATSGTLTFNIGDTTKTITIPTTTDLVEETNETFRVTLTSAIYNIFTDNVGIATILDATNATPVAVNDSTTGNANAAITGNLLSNDTDADLPDDSLSVAKINGTAIVSGVTITLPSGAELTVNNNGTFSYNPLTAAQFQALALGQTDTDSFTYTIRDSQNAESTATVTLEIDGVNDAPTVLDPFVELPVDEDAANSVIALAAHFTDVDAGDELTYSIVSNTQASLFDSVTIDNLTQELTLVYTPNAYGSAIVTIRATDLTGSYVDAPLSISIAPINDAPLADDDTFTTPEDTELTTGNVLTNDSDLEGDALTAELVTGPAHGTLTLNTDGSFSYVPFADFQGEDSFTYRAHDGDLLGNIATVTITIASVNDAPIANDDSYETGEGTVLNIALASGLLANDTDVDLADTLAVVEINGVSAAVGTAITLASGALLTVNSDSSFQYDPSSSRQLRALSTGETFADSFDYTLRDADGAEATANVSITVHGLTGAGAVYFAEDASPVEIATLRNFFAEVFGVSGGPAISFTLDGTNDLTGGLFTAALVDGVLTINPQPNAHGIGQLLLHAFDGAFTATTLLEIHIASVNDAPQVVSAIDDRAATEDGTVTAIDLAGYFEDVDLDELTLTATSSNPDLATPNITAGSLGITLVANAHGSAIITVRATDPSGAYTESSFQLTVTAVNDAPSVANALANISLPHSSADQTFNLTTVFADVDGDTLAFTANSSNPTVGTVSVANGVLTFHFVAGQTGETNITVRATDPSGAYVEDHLLVTATGLPYVSNLHLVNDTGASATDRITSDPTLTGTVLDDFQGGTVRVEFDHQGDGVADGYVDVAESGDSFSYDPRLADSVVNQLQGDFSLRYRVVARDSLAEVYYTSAWSDFSIDLSVPKISILTGDGSPLLASSFLDWGHVLIGVSKSISITIKNVGASELLFDEINSSLPTGFSFATPLPNSLSAGEEVNVGIVFQPLSSGSVSGTVGIASNDPATPALNILVLGESQPLIVENVQLVFDTGTSNADRFTYDPTLTGQVLGDIVGSTIEVEFDLDSNGSVDATEVLLLDGTFAYDPRVTNPALAEATGPLQIRYRVKAHDGETITHQGLWQSFNLTLASNPNLGDVRIDSFGLFKDTGWSTTDFQTANPTVKGTVLGDFAGGIVKIEFDHDGDELVDGTATIAAAGNSLLYDPRISEPAYGSTTGSRVLNYRIVQLDELGAVAATGDWAAFTFELLAVQAQSQVLGLSLSHDTGANGGDKITSDPTLQGSSSGGAFSSVEFDWDNDGVVDDARLTDTNGHFEILAGTLSDGPATVRARSSEWNQDAGIVVKGDWVSFTFTIAPNPIPPLTGLALVNDDGNSNGDFQTTKPQIKGSLQGEPIATAGVKIEFDHNQDGIADGVTWTDGSGLFQYLPLGISSGYITIRARGVGTDGEAAGTWQSISYSYLGVSAPTVQMLRLAMDTGSSASDNVTIDPTILGITTPGETATLITVEFDHNNDQIIDGNAYVDGAGTFRYRPTNLAPGSYTLRARTKVHDEITGADSFSDWSSLTFTLEAIANVPVTVATLALVRDTGISATDGITSDASLQGKLANDGSTAYLTVQVDYDADGIADDSVVADATGEFLYLPTLPAGASTLRFRGREFDAASGAFAYGNWTSITLTYEPWQNNVATVQSLVLASDSGSSQVDLVTANPLVVGQISNDGALQGIRVEFDTNSDNAPDGFATTDATGRFTYLPTFTGNGTVAVRARVAEWNAATASYLIGSWSTLTFDLESQASAPAIITQFGLLNDNGSSATDLTTSDTTLAGRIVNENALQGVLIEVDFNGDQLADVITTTDLYGQFTITPANLALGLINVAVRTREVDNATQQVLSSGWTTFTFTHEAPSVPQLSIDDFELLEDTGSSNSDQVTTNATLTGIVLGVADFAGVVIEFDHDNDGFIDGTAAVDINGRFNYLPADLAIGIQTLRARTKLYPANGSPITTSWISVTFTLEAAADSSFRVNQLALYWDTGASNSDRVTSNAAITGTIANNPGYFAADVEFDQDSDGVADGSATVNSFGQFTYTPTDLSPGLVTLRVRATASDTSFQSQFTPWKTLAFVYAANPDAPEAQALASGLTDYDTVLAVADLAYTGSMRTAGQTYNSQSQAARNAYETSRAAAQGLSSGALRAIDEAYQSSLAGLNTDYLNAVAATNTAFQTAITNYQGTTATYSFNDFAWPTQDPDANVLSIPDPASQPTAPAIPTYSGEDFNVIGTYVYQQELAAAEAARNIAEANIAAAFNVGVAADQANYKIALEQAQAELQTKISNAKAVFTNAIKPQVSDINLAAERSAHDQRVAEATENYAQEVARADEKYYRDVASWDNYAIAEGLEPYQLQQYARDLYTQKFARVELYEQYVLDIEAAKSTRDKAIAASQHTLATKEVTYIFQASGRRIIAEHDFNSSIAIAQQEYQYDLADAHDDLASSTANRTYARDGDLAEVQDVYDRSYAAASLHAWQMVHAYAPSQYTAYQLQLSEIEEVFLRQTSESRLERDASIAEAANQQRLADVNAEADHMRELANAERDRVVDRSIALKTYRLAVRASEHTRTITNVDIWKAQQDRIIELNEQFEARSITERISMQELGTALIYRDRGFLAAPFGVFPGSSHWPTFEQNYDWQTRTNKLSYEGTALSSEITASTATAKNAAIREYVYGYLNAERESLGSTADARADYEVALANAEESYNETIIVSSLDLRGLQAEAENGYQDKLADASFTFDTDLAELQFTRVIGKSEALQDFVANVASDYVALVSSWDAQQNSEWSAYQLDLALAHESSANTSSESSAAYSQSVATATLTHALDVAAKDKDYHKSNAVLQSKLEIDIVAKRKQAAGELAAVAKQMAADRSNAIKIHDKEIIDQNEVYQKALTSGEEQLRNSLLDADLQYNYTFWASNILEIGTSWQRSALYNYNRNVWNSSYPLFPEGEANPVVVTNGLRNAANEAVADKRTLDRERADRDYDKTVATARESWTTQTSTIKVALAESLATIEIANAGNVRDKNIALLDDVAELDIGFQQDQAALDTTYDADLGQLSLTLDNALLAADLTARTDNNQIDSAQRSAEESAQQNYIVALHQRHADQLQAVAMGATSLELVLANYQWQMAEAGLAHAISTRDASTTYHASLTEALAAETARANIAVANHQAVIGAAELARNNAINAAASDFSTKDDTADIEAQRDISKAREQLTAASASADATHRRDLALAERDRVNALAVSDRQWVHEYADSYYAFWQAPGDSSYYIREAEIANSLAAHQSRNEQIAQQFDLDRAEAAVTRATTLGTVSITHATAVGDAGVALGSKRNSADSAYQSATSSADLTFQTILVSANETQRLAVEASTRLTKVATGGAAMAYQQSLATANIGYASSSATAAADYHIADAEFTVETLFTAFAGQPLSAFTTDELYPYASALAKRDWLTATKPDYISYVVTIATANADYSGTLLQQNQASALAEMDASSSLASTLAGLASTRDNLDRQLQYAFDGQLVSLANGLRGSRYEADSARLLAYAESDSNLALANAVAEREYREEILGLSNPTWEELQTLSADLNEAQALATKAAAISLAGADLMWVNSVAAAEGGFAISEAQQINSVEAAVAEHQKVYSLTAANTQFEATLAKSARLNDNALTNIAASSTRATATAGAWGNFATSGYANQLEAVGNYVEVLDGIPWAYFVVAHSEATQAWWSDVSDLFLQATDDNYNAQLANQLSINASRTASDTVVATAQKARDIALATITADSILVRSTDLTERTAALVNANIEYQFSMATAVRDQSADLAHIAYSRAMNVSSLELSVLETAALDQLNTATQASRLALGVAQANVNGVYQTSDASRRLGLSTSRLSIESTYINNRTASDIDFATTVANGNYNLTVEEMISEGILQDAIADSRVAFFSQIGIDHAQPVDIGPWESLAANIAVAERDRLLASVTAISTAVADNADKERDLSIDQATNDAGLSIAKTVVPATYEVATDTARLVSATALAVANNVLAGLGLYSADLPKTPVLAAIDRPVVTPASVDHYFNANDPLQEPYAALLNDTFRQIASGTLTEPSVGQFTSNSLQESVEHVAPPTQEDAATRFNRERSVNAIGNFGWRIAEYAGQTLVQSRPLTALAWNQFVTGIDSIAIALIAFPFSDAYYDPDSYQPVDVTAGTSSATGTPLEVHKGSAAAAPQSTVTVADMQTLMEANFVEEVVFAAETARNFVDRIPSNDKQSSADPWYVRLFDGRHLRESLTTASNLVNYGSLKHPARHAAVLRMQGEDGDWVNYIYALVPEATKSETVIINQTAYGGFNSYQRQYVVPEHWQLIGIKKSPDAYSPAELAQMFIWDIEDIGATELAANLLELPLYFIPGVGTALDFSKGEYVNGTVSLVADLALGAGAIAKGFKALNHTNKALKTMRVAYALEVTATVGQGVLALKDVKESNFTGAASNAAPLLFQVLGLRAMKADISDLSKATKATPPLVPSRALEGQVVRPLPASEGLHILQSTCFVAGTPLLTPAGCLPIEQFRPGDAILSRSEHDPQAPLMVRHVERVFELSAPIVELRVNGRVIRTTAEHPFYVLGAGWKRTADLLLGDRLVSHTHQPVIVEGVRFTTETETVYNLRVADDHTYFVGHADWGFSVWAHNTYTVRQIDGLFVVVDANGARTAIQGKSLDEVMKTVDELKIQLDPIGDVLEPAGILGGLVKVGSPDPAADALAKRLGGESRVKFSNGPDNEFDVVSDLYVAQSKPANFVLNKNFRDQAKTTFEVALRTGRRPYFHFEGPPHRDVLRKLAEYAKRYNIEPVVDISPLKLG